MQIKPKDTAETIRTIEKKITEQGKAAGTNAGDEKTQKGPGVMAHGRNPSTGEMRKE